MRVVCRSHVEVMTESGEEMYNLNVTQIRVNQFIPSVQMTQSISVVADVPMRVMR